MQAGNQSEIELAVVQVNPYETGYPGILHIMEKRFVFVRNREVGSGQLSSSAGAAGGLLGTLVVEGINAAIRKVDSGKKERMQQEAQARESVSLNQKIASDSHNWQVPFDQVEEVVLTKGGANKNISIRSPAFKKGFLSEDKKTYALSGAQVDYLRPILTKIPALEKKLKLKFGFFA